MNIELLIANLENTIAGKELYLAGCTNPTARQFVQLNVDELKRILADTKVVQEQVLQLEVALDGFVHGSLWLTFSKTLLIYFHDDIQDVYSHWRQKEIDC